MMENRVRMDMLYVENWSFWLDIKIILQTVLNIFKKEEYAY
jgi:putative colanic acid biosynthesis UDP-glucose lipid carrier transferase